MSEDYVGAIDSRFEVYSEATGQQEHHARWNAAVSVARKRAEEDQAEVVIFDRMARRGAVQRWTVTTAGVNPVERRKQ